ncbi:MAG: tectonin domain-containing protein [Chitinophagaceae bacterium]
MKSYYLLLLAFVLLSMADHPSGNTMSSWVKLSGSDGKDICVNDKGEFYLVNTVNKLYKYEGPKWKELSSFNGTKSYAENKGIRVWFTGRNLNFQDCKKQGVKMNNSFHQEFAYDREPTDLAIGDDSTVWHVDSYSNKLLVSKCENYINVPSPGISRIAAGGAGVWMIDKQGKIFQLKDRVHVNMGWEQKPGGDARDITVTNDGYVFIVDNKGRIYQWTGFRWDQLDGSDGLRISANNRKIVLINTQREMYTRSY